MGCVYDQIILQLPSVEKVRYLIAADEGIMFDFILIYHHRSMMNKDIIFKNIMSYSLFKLSLVSARHKRC